MMETRRSLLSRMRDLDDRTSWNRFFETYWALIYGVARRAGLNDTEAQDVVQETVIAVAKRIQGFQYDPSAGSFRNWMLLITKRRIADQYRKKTYLRDGKPIPREELVTTSLLESHPDLSGLNWEDLWNQEWERHLLDLAQEKVKRQVSPLQFQMFQLSVFKGMTARQIAQRLGVKVTEVYLAKYKISALIKKEIRALERQRI